ncbi:hypothetical protein QIS74_13605 [Colletotrichum tabaci]|uniref:Transmembrane protein n=1 Tax=Colletotrichum tabaci TaxID=1209068 RepID=A0AAV9SSK0_9PEZI
MTLWRPLAKNKNPKGQARQVVGGEHGEERVAGGAYVQTVDDPVHWFSVIVFQLVPLMASAARWFK